MTSMEYVGAIFRMNAMVTGLVEQAVRAGDLRDDLPVEVMVHSIYSRTCDPALDFLRRGGRYTDADLVAHLVSIAFDGLAKSR
jgi:hypothetical protein